MKRKKRRKNADIRKDADVNIRISINEKQKFWVMAKQSGHNPSALIRGWMNEYVQQQSTNPKS